MKYNNFSKYGNVMIDLETLSTHTNACIISIALVEFNKWNGEIGDTCTITINQNEWGLHNRHIDGETIKWWMQNNKEIVSDLFTNDKDFNNKTLLDALNIVTDFIKKCDNDDNNNNGNVCVWGNGATMDITILQSAYEHFNLPTPWKYWAVNDVRTIVDLVPRIKEEYKDKFKGIKHNALNDCIHQIKYLSKTLENIEII